MSDRDPGEVVRLEKAQAQNQAQLRDHFLGWQCRIRQHAVRHEGGRPSAGMRPRVLIAGESLAHVVVLINKREPEQVTTEFRHLVLRTADPAEQYKNAVRKLSELYFQRPQGFSDMATALFGPASSMVSRLIDAGVCELEFDFQRQYYRIPCKVTLLAEHEPAFQATYWHNRLFNPAMPPGVQVLAFRPDWAHAHADPAPGE